MTVGGRNAKARRIVGATRVHYVGRERDEWFNAVGTHHTLCGLICGYPREAWPCLPLCEKCKLVAGAAS